MLSWLLGTSFPCWKVLTHGEELGAMLCSVEACFFLNVDGGGRRGERGMGRCKVWGEGHQVERKEEKL